MKTKKGYRGALFPHLADRQGAFDIVEINEKKEVIKIISYDY